MQFDLKSIEFELNKRLQYPYVWGTKQNDLLDKKTNFIYDTFEFEKIISKLKNEPQNIFNYAINRWFNFWSAWAVEQIFCSHQRVKPAFKKDKLVDFFIDGISFDHKTTVFPRAYNQNIEFAYKNPLNLIGWLYNNQSQQQRCHYKNRLFLVLYSSDLQHWKLKANISYIKQRIDHYIENFSKEKLFKLEFEKNNATYSDIVWIFKKNISN